MIMLVFLEIAVVVILLMMSAFFSSAEVAFFSLDGIKIRRIRHTNEAAGKHIAEILTVPTRLLSTILIGNTLVNVSASIVGYALFKHFWPAHAELISIMVMTVLLLIFGEVGPKRLAMLLPEKMAVAYAPIFHTLIPALTPLRAVLERITHTFRRFFNRKGLTLTEEEFESVVEMSGDEGILDEEERAMLRAIIRLEDLQASDVMTPRVDLIGIDLNDTPEIPIEAAREARVRYLLLYRDQLDQVDGLLDVRRFLLEPDHNAQAAWIPPIYVPESAPLDKLLTQFQREGRRCAVVVDEYGGTAGIISRGDILEEIVGEIGDEHEEISRVMEPLSENRWLVDGSVNLETINERLGLSLAAEGVDRLAGWIINQAERLPRTGEVIEAQGCRATVQRIRKHRIELAILEKADREAAR